MADYRAAARRAAQAHGLDPHIFERQINAESAFNPNAGSGAGAIGIAQFMPATARGLGINPRDPIQALNGAAKLMSGYVKKYGSYEKALRAYNAGEGAIEKSHGYAETNNYVAKILGGKDPGKLGAAAAPTVRRSSASPAQNGTSLPAPTQQPGNQAGAALVASMLRKEKRGGALLGVLDSVASSPDPEPATSPQQVVRNATKAARPTSPSSVAPVPKGSRRGKVNVVAGADRKGVSIQKPILTFLGQVAGASGRPITVTTGTNHNQMTTSGNVSDHWDGNAADLGMGGDARQSAAVDRKGTLVAAHAIQQAAKIPFAQAYAMAHKGGVWNYETKAGRVQILWKTNTGGNHFNHVHVGLNPNR